MSSSTKVVVKDKPKKKARVQFWSAECKYSVIIDRVNEHDWKSVDDEKQQGKVNLFWIDVATIHEHFRSIQPWQCINHFPGMPNIARKNKMGQNLNKMLKAYPKEYSFYPRTWILPGEIADFRNQFDSNGNSIGNKIYIIKPDAGCQGRGIYLTKTWEKVPLNENVVAQLYIKKPLLIDGYKFDLRIYVFVTSVKPLRVYLFRDGLVRMCTESYVKPTSKNLDQSCMHLTNYAVNKHNDNFQQPTDDDGDSGHKRSLQWFMDWIRAEHGDAKANWVWKRMGVIIMRTLLSIMPILSREYDQHFKSFTGVPVDMRKIAGAGVGYTASQPSSSSGAAGASGSEGASRAGRLQSRSNSIKGTERGQSKEREQDTDEENTSQSGKDERKETSSEQQNESEGEGEEASTGPKMRGSRCFEVLGYDIMLDSNLNPWVIEVNHLPSFGTDSPMDQDIKQRLMEQVFSVLPVMADDQVAYAAHHKAESEKRLVAQNRISAHTKKEREAKEKEAKDKAKPPLRPREPKKDYSVLKADGTLGVETSAKAADGKSDTDGARGGGAENSAGDDEDSDNYDEDVTPERLLEIKAILFDVYSKHSQEKLNKIDRLLAKYVTHEEEFLRFVLNKYSVNPAIYKTQSKGGAKNGVATPRDSSTGADTTAQGEAQGAEDPPSSVEEERPGTADGSANSADGEEEDNGNDTADESAAADQMDRLQIDTAEGGEDGNMTARTNGPKTDSAANRNQARDSSKRASRSMSPPRSSMPSGAPTSTRRAAAAWKTSTEEEDAKFRAEVLGVHVPKDDDEWLLFETSKLTEFTRLYPPMKSAAPVDTSSSGASSSGAQAAAAAAEAALEVEVQGEDEADEDDEENGGGNKDGNSKDPLLSPNGSTKNKEKAKSATYEELIFQAFLQDRRQTMRMHQPLQNRQKVVTDDNVSSSFLPPLDSGRSYSTINSSGKGAVGWKAPPKPARETVVRQPTQMQSDAAKRLSQGLSVASVNHSARQRYIAQNHLNLPNALASTGYSVVLDPHEYQQLQYNPSAGQNAYGAGAGSGAGAGASSGSPGASSTALLGGPYVPVYGGIYPAFNSDAKAETLWPSTKANRLLEESRLNRLRLEAAKANSAAVVRQQVFYFDPNYRDQTGAIATDGLTLIPPQAGGMPQGATSASTGGLLNTEYYDSNGSMVDDANRAPQPQQQQNQQPQQLQQGQGQHQQSRFAAHVGGSAKHGAGAGAIGGIGGSVKVRPIPTLTHVRHASTGNMNATLQAAAQAHGAGTSSHSQEELLRQLFPSWF